MIAKARDHAEIETAKANAINDFLRDMLVGTDPWSSGEHDLTVVEAMDTARAHVDSIFVEQPLVAAEMHATMGQTYLGLQRLTEAEEEVRRALEMQTAQLGKDHPDLAQTWVSLSKIQRFNMNLNEGISAGKEAVRIREQHLSPDDELMLTGYDNLAELFITDRKYAEADSILDLMDGIIADSREDRRLKMATSLSLRARIAEEHLEDRVAADSLYVQAIARLKEVMPDAPLLPIYLNNMAVNQMFLLDYERAKATYDESLALTAKLFGTDHPEYAVVLENLGGIAYRMGNYEECLANLEKIRDIRARNMGENHPTVMRTMLNMATVANGMGDADKAIAIYEEVMPLLTEINGEVHVDTATTLRNLALALRKAERNEEAEVANARARTISVELFGENHYKVALLDGDLSFLRMDAGRWKEAEALNLSGIAIFEESFGRQDPRTQKAASILVKIYQELKQPEKAAFYEAYAPKE